MSRITNASFAAAFATAFAAIGGLYGNIGRTGLMWIYVGVALVWAVNAVGTALGWTLDRERRRRLP